MQCPKCGAFNPDGFASCGICAEGLRGESSVAKPAAAPTAQSQQGPPTLAEPAAGGPVATGVDAGSQDLPGPSQLGPAPRPAVTWPDEAARPFDWGGSASRTVAPATGGNGSEAHPTAAGAASEPKSTIEDVASGQKLIIYAILTNLVTLLLAGALGSSVKAFLPLVEIAAAVAAILGLIRVTSWLGFSVVSRVLLMVAVFIPLFNLLILAMMSARATRALREAGYKVGLLGAQART